MFGMHKWPPRVHLSRWILMTSAMLESSMPWAKARAEAVVAVAAAAVDKADAAVVPVLPYATRVAIATISANQVTTHRNVQSD